MDPTIIQAGLASVESVINKALQYDAATALKLEKLNGKVLAIKILQPATSIYVSFGENLTLSAHAEQEPDTTLEGELSAFINLARHEDKHAALMQSDIQIQGSSQLAMGLAEAMGELDIDFEAMIAELTGPVAAHIIGKNLRSVSAWFKQTSKKFKQDSVEYVRDELQLAPHKVEGESRFADIHKLKLDAERLEARIIKLQQKLKS